MLQLAVQTEQIYTNNVKVIKTFYYSVNMPAFCKVEQIHVQFVFCKLMLFKLTPLFGLWNTCMKIL